MAFFEKNIRPLLAANCYPCHSSKLDKPMSGLVLDSRAGVLRGGSSGAPAVVPGKPDESLLIMAVKGVNEDLKMPPGKRLQPAEIANLEEWVRMGAPDPRTEGGPTSPAVSPYDWEAARKHRAFQAIAKFTPPRIRDVEWNHSSVDRFVKAMLDVKGLAPQPRASRTTLIRRAYYDLTGLPPTTEEVDAFLQDISPEAFEHVVDRLLASQRYGERWGRMWLDVRYSIWRGG